MTKFYFPHVQTVLKITSSAVQTRFSRLEQSLSWIFMKSAVIKITAYWGWTPPQKSDRRCIHNHFWPTSREKVFKIGRKSTVASAVILTLGQKSAVLAQCGVEFQKKILFSRCPGTCLVNDYKTNFFPHAHSGLHSDGKQKTANSGQIRSKATMPRHDCRVVVKFFSLPPRTSGQVGLLKLPIKWPYHNFIN